MTQGSLVEIEILESLLNDLFEHHPIVLEVGQRRRSPDLAPEPAFPKGFEKYALTIGPEAMSRERTLFPGDLARIREASTDDVDSDAMAQKREDKAQFDQIPKAYFQRAAEPVEGTVREGKPADVVA